jgi:hypothetical protein
MEPAGYLDWLKQQEPEIIFDPAKLHTKEDWIAAGKIVFETEIQFLPAREQPAAVDVPWPVGKNGELFPYRPLNRYIIRKKGVLEGGINACVDCHVISKARKVSSIRRSLRLGSNRCAPLPQRR